MSRLSNQKLGKLGEDVASEYLRRQGYTILERNFRARYGEIDIIVLKDNVVVFVEVKTRGNDSFGTPEESVTPKKLREVIKTSEYFSSLNKHLPNSRRIDVIGIQFERNKPVYIKHTQNVTM